MFPGDDGLVRAVEVKVKKVVLPAETAKRPLKLDQLKITTSTLRRPVTKLALLVPNSDEGVLHGRENVQAT